jgi:hypothetical protein
VTVYTSYFAFVRQVPKEFLVSIAGRAPDGFAGMQYRKLAPKKDWWREWHDKKLPNEWYVEKYNETVLDVLNPLDVLRELGDNKILLCWESPEKFCHRHLVAEWLKASGAIVAELIGFQRDAFAGKSP